MNWKGAPKDISKYEGFVYLIVCKSNGRKYIGEKTFWNKRTLKPLKGKKRRRVSYVESDWRSYYGSSKRLLDDLELYGEGAFERFILYLCHNKFSKHYIEAKLQFDNEVLFDDSWYNGITQVRLSKNNGLSYVKTRYANKVIWK